MFVAHMVKCLCVSLWAFGCINTRLRSKPMTLLTFLRRFRVASKNLHWTVGDYGCLRGWKDSLDYCPITATFCRGKYVSPHCAGVIADKNGLGIHADLIMQAADVSRFEDDDQIHKRMRDLLFKFLSA